MSQIKLLNREQGRFREADRNYRQKASHVCLLAPVAAVEFKQLNWNARIGLIEIVMDEEPFHVGEPLPGRAPVALSDL